MATTIKGALCVGFTLAICRFGLGMTIGVFHVVATTLVTMIIMWLQGDFPDAD